MKLRERLAAIWQTGDRFADAEKQASNIGHRVENVEEYVRDIDRNLQNNFIDNNDLDLRFESFERDTTDSMEDDIKEHTEEIEKLNEKLDRVIETMTEDHGDRLLRLEKAMDKMNPDWRKG